MSAAIGTKADYPATLLRRDQPDLGDLRGIDFEPFAERRLTTLRQRTADEQDSYDCWCGQGLHLSLPRADPLTSSPFALPARRQDSYGPRRPRSLLVRRPGSGFGFRVPILVLEPKRGN